MNDEPDPLAAPLAALLYRAREEWSPLPAWARFMLDAGARAASAPPEEGRLVIALSLPTRAFAAALASAAAVITAFRASPAGGEAGEHFAYLASLREGTAIAHHRSNSVQQGRLVGVDLDRGDGVPRIKFVTSRGNLVQMLPESLCTEIQVIEEPGALKVHKQKLVKDPDFLSRALPGVDLTALSARTRLDCVLVGVQHSLEADLTARQFGVGDDVTIYEGTLQGIVRARDIAGTKDAYRSAVVPAGSEDGEAPVSASVPRIVIFDGARAFNNWRSRWPDSNWLVLLDRGLSSADDGAAAINQGYATRLAESDALAGVDIPPGIEMLAYVERR